VGFTWFREFIAAIPSRKRGLAATYR
jgi:hypothetical protein